MEGQYLSVEKKQTSTITSGHAAQLRREYALLSVGTFQLLLMRACIRCKSLRGRDNEGIMD